MELSDPPTRAEIHVSDRISFKRCRRKWDMMSPLRQNLTSAGDDVALPLWFGTGWHFAVEDYHGYKRFSTPGDAFRAYAKATFKAKCAPDRTDIAEALELSKGMSDHYRRWNELRGSEFQVLRINGIPQVEVPFNIKIGDVEIDGCRYEIWDSGTFDAIYVDVHGRLWIGEYKTAAQFDTGKLETDSQVTSYVLAAELHYQREFEGVLYYQFRKAVPHPPEALVKGGFSKNKQQLTSYSLYRETLIQAYGKVPDTYTDFLNYLVESETPEGDRFIRRDIITRNHHQVQAEMDKILSEAVDMLSPRLSLYPNPTKDCSWDCPVRDVCIAMDDGSDWQWMIESNFKKREEQQARDDKWRNLIEWPTQQQKTP